MSVSIVVPELAFGQVQYEHILSDAIEHNESSFSERPENLDAIDVALAANELVLAVINTVKDITVKYEPVVGVPAVGIDGTAIEHFPLYYRPQNGPAGRGVHRHSTPEQYEYRSLPDRSANPLASDSANSEIGLVDFDLDGQAHDLLVLP